MSAIESTTTSESATLLARGVVVGRFVITGLLGRGGMGEVYAAYDPELDREVAIKLLRPEKGRGGSLGVTEGRARLLREAQAIARVSHPNVVVVYDTGTFQERVFIAMEFVNGHTLGYWMQARPRTWPEVLEVFTAAGRGLAAAHARDLVHRDFKPDNVMVGADGQVRVMDFGLVQRSIDRDRTRDSVRGLQVVAMAPRQTPAAPVPEEDVLRTRALGSSAPPLRNAMTSNATDVGLTRTGTMLGTPAYMSPEQFRGDIIDARTDQFSFCVALYEALYGERPFGGRTFEELSAAVTSGRMRAAPQGTTVPEWLREVLLRGLAVDPQQRWPSMDALLLELQRHPAAESRRRFATAAAAKLAGVWEAPTGDYATESTAKAEMRQAFLSTGKVYAASAFDGASQILDRYARRWSELYVEICEATHVRGEQSAEVLDLRMGCLQQGLEDLRALCRMFRQASAEVVENAVQAAAALGRLERCDDVALLRALVKPPEDSATRELVDALRVRLADARALSRVGRLNQALAAASTLESEARAMGYGPLLAETLLVLAGIHADQGTLPRASAVFQDALWTALLSHHDEVAADAAIALLYVDGHLHGSEQSAEIWARMGETLLTRMGGHDLLWGWLYNNRSGLREAQGRLQEALEDDRRALAAKEKVLGPEDPDVAITVQNMAVHLGDLGEVEQAVEFARRAAGIVTRRLGPDHPRIAVHLSNLSEFLVQLGRFDEAREPAERAVALYDQEANPNGLYVSYPLLALGQSLLGIGDLERAIPILERTARIRETVDGMPSSRGGARFALARALWQAGGDRDRAMALAMAARDDYRAAPATPANIRELAAVQAWLSDRAAPASTESSPVGTPPSA